MPYRFAFVLDQQVGLRTQALNMERVVSEDRSIAPAYIPVRYEAEPGFVASLPGIPARVKDTMRGVREIRDGMRGQTFQSALWATWAAKSVPDLVATAPAFFVMDMTPVQMEAMGAHYGYDRRRARFLAGLKRLATDRIYRAAEHFFPWSEFVARSLKSDYGISGEKITVVSPGVDLELFSPEAAVRPADGTVRLLFVGGDFVRKGGDLLLRWLRERPSDAQPPVEVHVVTREESLVAETGLVVHRNIGNNSPELIRLYRESDVFVLPTRADCYSLVAMEAMATGLPVVVTNIGGIPDIVSEGETGFLIAPDDYAALSERLDGLVADPQLRQRMSAAARSRAIEFFDCRRNIGRVLAKMKQTVGAYPA